MPATTPTPANPNANYFAPGQGGNPSGTTFPTSNTPAPTITSSSIAPATQTSVTQPNPPPQYPTATLGAAPVTPPLTETPQQAKQSGLLASIQDLTNQDSGKSAYATDQYKSLGFGMTYDAQGNIIPDAGTQDLQAKLTQLKNEALAIPLNVQNQYTGQMSVGDMSGQTAKLQRENAVQALQVSSTIDAINGNLATAQAKVNQALIQKFGPIEAQLQALQTNLKNIQADPQTSIEEKNAATEQQNAVAQQQAQIDLQKENYKTAQSLALAAVTNNPNDAQARLASQQAMQLSPSDPQYLKKVAALVGQYQVDVVQKSLDTQLKQAQVNQLPLDKQLKQAQLANTQANTRKTMQDIANSAPLSPNDTSMLPPDPNSQSILAQTGLSVAAFNYLTQGTSALSRLSSVDRQKIMKEAGDFLNKNGLDYSTFQSQYKAQNDVVQQNITRAANTKVFGGEVSGTVSQFIQDVGADIPNLKPAAVAQLFATGQTNDATAQKYAFDLQTMQNDLAGYYAASRGATSPDQADLTAAAKVITNGLSGKGAAAFKQSIDSNVSKVANVVNEAVTNAQQSVWNQFGVGDKYKPSGTSSSTSTTTLPPEVDSALSSNATVDESAKTVTLPRSVWSKYPASMDAIKAGIEAKGYKLLIQ